MWENIFSIYITDIHTCPYDYGKNIAVIQFHINLTHIYTDDAISWVNVCIYYIRVHSFSVYIILFPCYSQAHVNEQYTLLFHVKYLVYIRLHREIFASSKIYSMYYTREQKRENGKDLLPNNKIFVFCVNVCKCVCSPAYMV